MPCGSSASSAGSLLIFVGAAEALWPPRARNGLRARRCGSGTVAGRSTGSLGRMRTIRWCATTLGLGLAPTAFALTPAYSIDVVSARAYDSKIEISLYKLPCDWRNTPSRDQFTDLTRFSTKSVVVRANQAQSPVRLDGAKDACWVRWCEAGPRESNVCEILSYPLTSSVIRLR